MCFYYQLKSLSPNSPNSLSNFSFKENLCSRKLAIKKNLAIQESTHFRFVILVVILSTGKINFSRYLARYLGYLVILVIPDCPILSVQFSHLFFSRFSLLRFLLLRLLRLLRLTRSQNQSIHPPSIRLPNTHPSNSINTIIRLLHSITKFHSCGITAPTGCQSHRYKVIPTRSCYIEPSSTGPLMYLLACHLSLYCVHVMCSRYYVILSRPLRKPTQTHKQA